MCNPSPKFKRVARGIQGRCFRYGGRPARLLPRIASLSRREQPILRGRYGLDGPVPTLRSLDADLGISAERVRQLEQQALDTLHAAATQAPTSS
jgi:DNA-directed RNA polymerase sigma subunit (sigma70/sigma32)